MARHILITLITLLIFFMNMFAAVPGRITASGTQFSVCGNRIWMNGANTPWDNWNDFGGTYDSAFWNQHFADLHAAGINSTRIWITCSGEVGINISTGGVVTGGTAAHWSNLDDMFAKANANGIYIMATLISFDHFKNTYTTYQRWRNWIASDSNIDTYINTYLTEFLNRYGNNNALWSIDLCNEPEWASNTENTGEPSVYGAINWTRLQTYFAKAAVAIHKWNAANGGGPMVTVGMGYIKYNTDTRPLGGENKISDADLAALISVTADKPLAKMDFWSTHYYPWQNTYGGIIFTYTPSSFGLPNDRPSVVGECPNKYGSTRDGSNTSGYLKTDYTNGYNNGWQGFFPWTSNNAGSGDFGDLDNELRPAAQQMLTLIPTWVFPPNCAAATNTPTRTNTAVPPTSTFTFTRTNTNTPVPPTSTYTNTRTNTFTHTNTPVPPTATFTNTRTNTFTNTNTPVPPTSTFTNTRTHTFTNTETPLPPTLTFTNTNTNTFTRTNTAIPPTYTYTATGTNTQVPPTATFTATNTATGTYTNTAVPPTFTYTNTLTHTGTAVVSTYTYTSTATQVTDTSTATLVLPSVTYTETFSHTGTASATSTPTDSNTAIHTATFTYTATIIFTGTNTMTAMFTSTNTFTVPASTFTDTATATCTYTHTQTGTSTALPATSTFTPTVMPSSTNTYTHTNTPIPPTPTYTATNTFTHTPTVNAYPEEKELKVKDTLIYPNPVLNDETGKMYISFTATKSFASAGLVIYSASYRKIKEIKISGPQQSGKVTAMLARKSLIGLANGTYYYVITLKGSNGEHGKSNVGMFILVK